MRTAVNTALHLIPSGHTTSRTYQPTGRLAVLPQAVGATLTSNTLDLKTSYPTPQVTVVSIGGGGPLEHHVCAWADSYDALKERVREALTSQADTILLSIDSPGGMLAGCFDTVSELRTMAQTAGKRLCAYVDSMATSAAYALACAADQIFCPVTGVVGSIGVVECLPDMSVQDTAMGVRFQVVASGARKADLNIHVPFEDRSAGLIEAQRQIDALAEVFFELVASHRPLSVDEVRRLEAGTLFGAHALQARLVDQLATLDETVAILSSPVQPAETETKEQPMKYADVMRALTEAGSSDWSEEEKAAASKLMNALATESEPAEEPKEDKPAEEPKEEEDPKASPTPETSAIAAVSARLDSLERNRLLDSRPDFTAEVRKTLATASLPIVQTAVQTWPKLLAVQPTATPRGHVAGAQAALSTPRTQGQPAEAVNYGLPLDQKNALAERMGLAVSNPGPRIKHEPMARSGTGAYVFEMPAMNPVQQRQYLTRNNGGQS